MLIYRENLYNRSFKELMERELCLSCGKPIVLFRFKLKEAIVCEPCYNKYLTFDCSKKVDQCYNKDSAYWQWHKDNMDATYCQSNSNKHCCPYEEHKL